MNLSHISLRHVVLGITITDIDGAPSMQAVATQAQDLNIGLSPLEAVLI